MSQLGYVIETDTIYDENEILGVNRPEDLERSEQLLRGGDL